MEITLIPLVWLAVYLLTCLVWPYASCGASKCEAGKVRSPNGKTWRNCRRCGGSGRRHRLGAKLMGRDEL